MGKKIEELDVQVDELALSLVGWQVENVRARLVTESFDGTHFQEIAVSGTARFLREDWTDRFSADEDDDYPPTLLLGLSPVERPEAVSYTPALLETIRKAGKRPVRFSQTSSTWETSQRVGPEQIALQVTSFDVGETDLDLTWPGTRSKPLPVELMDETVHEAVRLRPTTCDATIVGAKDEATLQVRVGGFAEFTTARELLTDLVAMEPWRGEAPEDESDVEDECPFEVPLPALAVEVLDDSDFLLDKRETPLYGRVPVGEGGAVPSRQPRWIVQLPFHLDDLSGKPTRVVVRVLDAEDL
ncbi:hypothetical protein OYE22_12225 [Streptomyces sp. 71268]|uniref:hypothetical protein n=1 Tax=Streptomyces sp. 71268 TaxID=3002640 RepID=UPI0023F98DE8|nr:hypothetical protein [Streptomyces sp. 71268]WEV25875.1 hypothetical protein OYE22_12225 [Streptomyces sp. 71268]